MEVVRLPQKVSELVGDVAISNPDAGQFLKFDADTGKWINYSPEVTDIEGLDQALGDLATGTISPTERTKLAGIAAGATANRSDSATDAAIAAAVAPKAPLDSPELVGLATAPTPDTGDDSTKIATTAFVADTVRQLTGLAPEQFDTLAEIATAVLANQDSDAALAAEVATKLTRSSNLSDLTNAATARSNLGLSNVTNIDASNAANITSGTLADARLSSNVALLNAVNAWASTQNFGGASGSHYFDSSGNLVARNGQTATYKRSDGQQVWTLNGGWLTFQDTVQFAAQANINCLRAYNNNAFKIEQQDSQPIYLYALSGKTTQIVLGDSSTSLTGNAIDMAFPTTFRGAISATATDNTTVHTLSGVQIGGTNAGNAPRIFAQDVVNGPLQFRSGNGISVYGSITVGNGGAIRCNESLTVGPDGNSTTLTLRSGNGPVVIAPNGVTTATFATDGSVVFTGSISASGGTFTKNAIAATSTDGLVLTNTTAATSGATLQMSPRLHLTGKTWDTTTSGSKSIDFISEVLPVSGTTSNLNGVLRIGHSIDGGAYFYTMGVDAKNKKLRLYWGDDSGNSGFSSFGASSGGVGTDASVFSFGNCSIRDNSSNVGLWPFGNGYAALGNSTNSATSGQQYAATIAKTYNQTSSTAANTDLLINRTETSVGSGTQLLIDAQVGGASKFKVDRTGNVTATKFTGDGSGLTNLPSSGGLTWTKATTTLAAGASYTLTHTADASSNRIFNVSASSVGSTAVPMMTSNTAPSGTASASSNYGSNFAWRAFDRVSAVGSTDAWITNGTTSGWLQYQFTTAKTITYYSLTGQADSGYETNRSPKNWTLQGSNDGSSWTTLDTRTNQTSWTLRGYNSYTVASPGSFTYYRLNVTANNGDAYLAVGELILSTYQATTPLTIGAKNIDGSSSGKVVVEYGDGAGGNITTTTTFTNNYSTSMTLTVGVGI